MRAVTLLYHDAVEKGGDDASGFPGKHASIYKLETCEMERHFQAVRDYRDIRTAYVTDFIHGSTNGRIPFFLTFDDGGISAATRIADLLDKFGWTGHFFVTGAYIDTPAFVSSEQILELRKRGHIIGSHSWSHPTLMGKCGYEEVKTEWVRSVEKLSDILGEQVETASIPGGYYTLEVAKAASASGIRALFTSEPVKKAFSVDECLVFGRYTVVRGAPPSVSRELASNMVSQEQIRQFLLWNVKKVAKKVVGNQYLALQKLILNK